MFHYRVLFISYAWKDKDFEYLKYMLQHHEHWLNKNDF